MLDHVIAFSLRNRALVLLAAALLMALGAWQVARMPVDVFPDLNRPTVTVLTEAPGLAPEEVEVLVSRPLEYLLNGATGVQRVRSSSGAGLSVLWVEFDWGTDIYVDRQVVSEKLQLARERLPADARSILAPISSIMGEILLLGLRSTSPAGSLAEQEEKAMQLRTLAEFTVRNQLQAIEGVALVTVMGGTLRQYQVVTSPERLAARNVTLAQLVEAAEKANVVAGGGVLERTPQEALIRITGQSLTLTELGDTPVVWREPRAILIRDVADVRFGGPVKRGDSSVRKREGGAITGGPAVLLTVQKQPGASTLELTPKIDRVLDQLQRELPPGVVIERHIFRQADFIRSAIDNVAEAVRDGTVWVFVVLFLFLWNFRTSAITLLAIPLSLLMTALVFRLLGVSINTMTLGGIAVAVGELVDDAVVDVENIYRRLRQNAAHPSPPAGPPSPPTPLPPEAGGEGSKTADSPSPLWWERGSGGEGGRLPALQVVFLASTEVRGCIVYATLIVCVVVLPLFFLSGLEGRLFAPLGLAYLVSLLASLAVSLTVTPVLASLLLPGANFLKRRRDPLLLRSLKWLDEKLVRWSLRHRKAVLVGTLALAGLSKVPLAWMGREFLPAFNEGTLTVNVQTEPGTDLAESGRVAGRVEDILLRVPEVLSVARRTGRAEGDEHAEGVHSSEIDVRLIEHQRPKPGWGPAFLRAVPGLHSWGVETTGRPHDTVMKDVRERLSAIPGIKVNVGQPIAHRLDHLLSGVRAQVAIKVFGPDLHQLRSVAHAIESRLAAAHIAGLKDLQVEPQVEVPQLRITVNRKEAARHGLAPGDVASLAQTAFKGRLVSTVLDGEQFFDLVVWYEEGARRNVSAIAQTILDTPSGRKVALGQVAEVTETTGPNLINRERVQRRVVVSCNAQDRDLGSMVADIQKALRPVEEELARLPGSYRLEYGGQFEAQRQASSQLLLMGLLVLVAVFLLLWRCLGSWVGALMVLGVNLPLAAIGSVTALLVVNRPDFALLQRLPWWQWPQVWASGTTLSVAHLVGFITLVGIVSRNGLLMISHYIHLMKHEGQPFGDETIVRGSLERLAPVLMTAGVAIIGLVPLALGAGQSGKEILHPLAVVVIGGLLDSALMDQVVTPAVFSLFGRFVYDPGRKEAGD